MRENCVLQPFCSQHAICLSHTQLKLTFQLQLKFDHQHTTLDTPATAPRCIPASLAQRHGHLVSHVSSDVKEHLHLEKRRLRDECIRTVTVRPLLPLKDCFAAASWQMLRKASSMSRSSSASRIMPACSATAAHLAGLAESSSQLKKSMAVFGSGASCTHSTCTDHATPRTQIQIVR
jgi:hypothetical protein